MKKPKIVFNRFLPFKGFLAINLFGIIFVRKYRNRATGELENPTLTKRTIRHEQIHTAQMRELLYIPFYILYFIFWLINIFRFGPRNAYFYNCFEQEAFDNELKWTYLDKENRKRFAWTKYIKRKNKINLR